MNPDPLHRRRKRWEKILRCRFQSLAFQTHSAGYVSVQNNGRSFRATLAILMRSLCRDRSEKLVTSLRGEEFCSKNDRSEGVTIFAKPAPRNSVILPNGLLWLFDKPGV